MRQGGVRAYMSDRTGLRRGSANAMTMRTEYEHVFGPPIALAEARAILAETEPINRDPRQLWKTAQASIYAIATGRRWGARMVADMEAGEALAASLAAILPVLDELEAEAGR